MECESVLLQEVLITYKVYSVLRLNCEHSGICCVWFYVSEIRSREKIECIVSCAYCFCV